MSTETDSDPRRLGVLAFGDSITNGGGELQWGVALQSWALWVARGLGLPYSPNATDGAVVGDVTELQIPAFRAQTANPAARYDLGCLYVGTNDVRQLDWDPREFEAGLDEALRFLAARCDRVLVPTIPLDMGRPRNRARVQQANDAIGLAAGRHRALLLDLREFGARNLMMADHVHPTAFGQIAIAERALELLAADGMPVRVRPSRLILYNPTWLNRLRGDLTYLYRRAKVGLRWRLIELTARQPARAGLRDCGACGRSGH
jgi:lysophospholipase L1-like esterase